MSTIDTTTVVYVERLIQATQGLYSRLVIMLLSRTHNVLSWASSVVDNGMQWWSPYPTFRLGCLVGLWSCSVEPLYDTLHSPAVVFLIRTVAGAGISPICLLALIPLCEHCSTAVDTISTLDMMTVLYVELDHVMYLHLWFLWVFICLSQRNTLLEIGDVCTWVSRINNVVILAPSNFKDANDAGHIIKIMHSLLFLNEWCSRDKMHS